MNIVSALIGKDMKWVWDTSHVFLTLSRGMVMNLRGSKSGICPTCPCPESLVPGQGHLLTEFLSLEPSPSSPHTHTALSLCSQGWGPLGTAPVGWHLLAGLQAPGSLADNSGNPKSGGHLCFQPELLGPEGRFCSLHHGVWPRGSPQETWRDSAHMLSYLIFTPQTLLAGTKE